MRNLQAIEAVVKKAVVVSGYQGHFLYRHHEDPLQYVGERNQDTS